MSQQGLGPQGLGTTVNPVPILVVRPDRLGDVILSTPVVQVLRRNYPKSRIIMMVREELAPIVRGLEGLDDVMTYDPTGRHAGIRGWFKLVDELRAQKFKISVVLFSHARIASALFVAGVRYRVGPLSRIHSFLFFNKGYRQRRSQVEMHEADYNLQLLRRLGISTETRVVEPKITVSPLARDKMQKWLREAGAKISYDPFAQKHPLLCVHPGMGGSALNWPEEHYVELLKQMLADDQKVVMTLGPNESALGDRIKASLGEYADKLMVYHGASIEDLAALLSFSAVMVAPSTGPMHLANALGVRIVTFFPPIRVQSAIRWGPYSVDETRLSVLVPDVYCGEDFKCRGNLCNYYPCMRSLKPSQAVEELRRHLSSYVTKS